jgi:hypothetical protein
LGVSFIINNILKHNLKIRNYVLFLYPPGEVAGNMKCFSFSKHMCVKMLMRCISESQTIYKLYVFVCVHVLDFNSTYVWTKDMSTDKSNSWNGMQVSVLCIANGSLMWKRQLASVTNEKQLTRSNVDGPIQDKFHRVYPLYSNFFLWQLPLMVLLCL